MPVTLLCPSLKCRRVLQVPETTRGHRVRCGYCGQILIVPQAEQGKQSNPPPTETTESPLVK